MLISFEGIDGAGKSTQCEMLNLDGYRKLKFARYNVPSGQIIKRYLAGELPHLNAYAVSSLYSLNRAEAIDELHGNVIIDRYVGSNAIHQGVKFDDPVEYFKWLDDYEYNKLGVPRPDLTIFLRVPYTVALQRIASRGEATDIHEQASHLSIAERVADAAATFFGWRVVDGTRDAESIHSEVTDIVNKHIRAKA